MTALAPAVRNQRALLTKNPLIMKLCHAISNPVLVMNEQSQVVFANHRAVELTGLSNDRLLQGSRLEDVFSGIHLNSEIHLEPIVIEGEHFSLLNLKIANQNSHRQNLERTFFHDILNTAGGMQGLTEILQEATPEEIPELTDTVKNMADQLVDEIISQRDLLAAESGELKAHPRQLESHIVINSVMTTYRTHPRLENRTIEFAPGAKSLAFTSDPVLLSRILGNMVKNAMEACVSTGVITLNCGKQNNQVWFSVHNLGTIAPEVQPRIFEQSFSTKGKGRGTGTFSMKLFSEKYLSGHMSFETHAATGTTFKVSLPIDGP